MTRYELLQVAKPVLFNTEMVRAILEGRKTVTRRLIKPQPKRVCDPAFAGGEKYAFDQGFSMAITFHSVSLSRGKGKHIPYHAGDMLYIRETWQEKPEELGDGYFYKADAEAAQLYRWRPSIHMPKDAARIFLNVKEVRAERLQQISAGEVAKEGVCRQELHTANGCRCAWERGNCQNEPCANREAYETLCWTNPFADLWNSTIRKADLNQYGWEANPWVWVIEFERVMPDA